MKTADEYKVHMLARKELRRMLEENQEWRAPWTRSVRANVRYTGYFQFGEVFEPLSDRDAHVCVAMQRYCKDLHGAIMSQRRAAAHREEYRPLRQDMDAARRAAGGTMSLLEKKGCPTITVRCEVNAAEKGEVEVLRGEYVVRVGPTWKRKVHANGLHTAEWGQNRAFIMRATPKASAFLMREGISVWEAMAFLPTTKPKYQEGFIFRSSGSGGDFCIFHTDFMKGATLIRKRVRDAVLEAMGLGKEVQSNK